MDPSEWKRRAQRGHRNLICFFDGGGNLGQLVDRSDGSLHATYGYGGPKGEMVGDPCLEPPETFDDCNMCTNPCYRVTYHTVGLPEPHGVALIPEITCNCGAPGGNPGDCGSGGPCDPGAGSIRNDCEDT